MTVRGSETRIARLEQYRQLRSAYVMRVSQPPTAEELAAIEKAKAAGRRFALLPNKCATTEEWLALYGHETLQ
jgi:hypothetical protein